MIVCLRRMVILALLLSVLSACEGVPPDQVGRFSSTHYNCLNLGNQIQVQLNTHLEPVPETEFVHSTSPDGNYQIVSIARTQASLLLYLRDVNTGEKTVLDDAVYRVIGVLWAPNSQYVNYDWEDMRQWRYHGIAATQTGEILLDKESFAGIIFEAFSFDGEYLAMHHFNPVTNYQITVHPTRHYRYDEAIATLEGVNLLAWSPVDRRLAYATVSGFGVLDLDTGVTHQEPHFNEDQFIQSRSFGALVWSPDGRYLTISYQSSSTDYEMGIYSTEDQSLTLFTTFTVAAPLLGEPFTPDGRYITYFVKLNSEDPYFDLWRFDMNTSQHELLADHLTSQHLSGETFVFARETPDEWLLEIRDRSGFLLRSYALSTADQGGMWSCQRLDAPFDKVIDCQQKDDFILVDDSMTAIWRTNLQDDDSPKVLGFWTSDDQRFVARSFSQGERVWLEFIDLTTRHIYRLPERFRNVVPLGVSGLGKVDVYPAPDEQSWLVVVDQALLRLYPTNNTWELLDIDSRIDHIVWSPDGQRYAVITKYDDGTRTGDLFVRERDESKQWSLGAFPTAILNDMTWTHCGDILAPLRDYLAAQSLD